MGSYCMPKACLIRFLALIEKGEADCVTSSGLVKTGYECLTKADYDCAIQNFLEVIATTDDLERKAKFELLIGYISNDFNAWAKFA